jgi:eukaryotic-like serine/threonine-protein kinase
MNPERWGQIERLYHAALEREPKDRGKFLAGACEGDTELHRELESLLAHGKTTETFPEKSAMEFAAPVLVDDHARQHGIDADRPRADFRRHETEHAGCSPRPPWWMYLIAASFLAHVVFITAFWFLGPESMGIDVRPTKTYPVVSKVAPDSPAQRAGIQPGDILVRANDQPVRDANYWYWFFTTNVETGQPITFEAERGGGHVRAVLLLRRRPAQYWSTAAGMIVLLNLGGRYIALAVACVLAFLRPRHLLACIGALFLAIWSAAELVPFDGLNSTWRHSPLWFQLLLWFANVLAGLGWGVWFTFFALFPRPSFHSRWVWTIVWTPPVLASLQVNYQVWHVIYSPEHMIPPDWMAPILGPCLIAYALGSFVMLAIKYRRLEGQTEKRRIRLFVVSLAFVIALAVPVVVYSQPEFSASPGASLFLSFRIRALANLAFAAFPLCFAYSILRHRLFDIRVIIRQGIRYAAAKQLLLLAAPAIIAVFLADLYAHRDRRVDTIVQDRGWIYLGLAGLAVLAHVRRQHWLQSLDRRFFRERYDAQEILRSTLEKVKAATNLADVAPTVVNQIGAAMHPIFCAILEHRPRERKYELLSVYPEGVSPPALRGDSKAVELAKVVAKPVQLTSEDSWLARQLPSREAKSLENSGVDLIAPVKGRESDALIVMGRKRSEEPYTSDDMRLLEDVSIGLALLPSRRFPQERFRLESKIGQGGMGTVYEAMDLQLDRKVAIKLISENLIADSAALDRFQREARILAGFQHPNVVTLFDVGVMPDGRPFLVMERLRGRTLREELNCRTRLSSDEARSIVGQLCTGLSAAHRRSLIHRDLKPENIFLCEDGAQRLVKILDFGLAKLFLETSTSAQTGTFSTLTGQIAGTPAYMSPELLSGAKPDWSCDIWALAVITHEMLAGQRPFFAQDGGLVESSLGGLPGCWRDFFNWSLAHEPSQRAESVDAFLERFERCAAIVYAKWQ